MEPKNIIPPNAMSKQEYDDKMLEINASYECAKNDLYIKYANSHRIYKVGDIISDSSKIILINRITACKSFGLPEPVYSGQELKKDLTPKKNGARGSMYGNNGTSIIKEKQEVVVNFKNQE